MKASRFLRAIPLWSAIGFFLGVSSSPAVVPPPFVFSGLPVDNPDFSMRVNEFGYSDSMLDYRAPFMGREYLSGEWAGAVYYEGGSLDPASRWITDRFVFPDFLTPPPNFASTWDPKFQSSGNNSYGYPVFHSQVANPDLRITMSYETVDFGASLSGRLALGLSPQSAGPTGSFLPSTRYGFRHTYEIENISGSPLTNLRFYQLLHTLYGDWGVYDTRDYGGGFSNYCYGITLQGESYSFNQITMETVRHTDTVAMKFDMLPSGFELGAFGFKEGGDHQTGEPAVGVHKSVTANSLNGTDFFDPDETVPEEDAWVAGAVGFDLGDLGVGAKVSFDMLLAINTTYQVVYPPIDLKIRDTSYANNTFTIDFEETTQNPLVGFSLFHTTDPSQPTDEWDQAGVPYLIDVPFIGWRRFQTGVDPSADRNLLLFVRPTIINPD